MSNFYAKFHAPLPTALWVSENPYLAEFEFGEESDGGRGIKLGPGYWNDLTYFTARVQRSYLTEDVVYNDEDTLADVVFGTDDTPFGGNVVSGGLYKVELNLLSTNASRALQLNFGGTANVVAVQGEWMARMDYANGETLRIVDLATAFDPHGTVNGVDSVFQFIGSIEIGTDAVDAGTFLLQGAQYAADASDTTILAGATMIITQMN